MVYPLRWKLGRATIRSVAELRERRRAPRAQIAVTCTLRRRTGSPIAARTLDVGAEGMRIASPRPLALDEWLVFEFEALGATVSGYACVLREEHSNVYGLRFERLAEETAGRLRALAA